MKNRQPETVSDFITLLQAVKEKYGDVKVRRVTDDYVNDPDEYYHFADVRISGNSQSLIYDEKDENETYLLFVV